MPIYDIQCKKCLYTEEKLFFTHTGLDTYVCPICKSIAWRKLPSKRTSWRFKVIDDGRPID